MAELIPKPKPNEIIEGLGRCPRCGGRSWVQGPNFANNIDCNVCGLGLMLDYDDSTARVWAKNPVHANVSVIDWDNDAERVHQSIEDTAKKLYEAGGLSNLKEEAAFLAGVAAWYFVMGKEDKVPMYILRPSLCQDSAFGFDYYDREHPLRHCKTCEGHPKMYQRKEIDPDEIARKVRPSRQKGRLVWRCPRCHDSEDGPGFYAPAHRS